MSEHPRTPAMPCRMLTIRGVARVCGADCAAVKTPDGSPPSHFGMELAASSENAMLAISARVRPAPSASAPRGHRMRMPND